VAAGDLVGHDPEPVRDDPSHQVSGEEPVLGAEHELRVHRRPRGEWLILVGQAAGALPGHRLLGEPAWDVVEERDVRVLVAGQPAVAGGLLADRPRVVDRRPPLGRRLAWPRHHPGDVHEHLGGQPGGGEGRGKGAERLPHDHHLVGIGSCSNDPFDAGGEAGLAVRKVGGGGLETALPELCFDQMPVPSDVARPMHEHEPGQPGHGRFTMVLRHLKEPSRTDFSFIDLPVYRSPSLPL
jgi:hypothetical protein